MCQEIQQENLIRAVQNASDGAILMGNKQGKLEV